MVLSREDGGRGGEDRGELGALTGGVRGRELRDKPTSTTDLLGDLGQLPSPVWASASSSVN